MIAFLSSGSPRVIDTGDYGTVQLIALEELRVETLAVTPNLAPFACDHPHADEYGHYAVPAVNLVVPGGPAEWEWFPGWLFLWLPVERRYGSYDIDHGDLRVFGPEVSWSQIAADPLPFVRASAGLACGKIAAEFLEPWHRYPFVVVEKPN